MSEEGSGEARKGGGCSRIFRLGCLGVLGATAIGALAIYFFLRGPDAELMYSGAPDPVATARLNQELEAAGLEGASALVIPIRGQTGQIAIVTFDESQGFQGTGEEGLNGLVDGLAQANQEGGFNISRVAIDYRGPDGENLYSVTTDQETLQAYADGQISREQMLANTDVDFSSLMESIEGFQEIEGAQ